MFLEKKIRKTSDVCPVKGLVTVASNNQRCKQIIEKSNCVQLSGHEKTVKTRLIWTNNVNKECRM